MKENKRKLWYGERKRHKNATIQKKSKTLINKIAFTVLKSRKDSDYSFKII
jgi:hypothetical protein